MANTSTTHIIVDKTITAANTTEQKFTAPFNVVSFRIRNNEAATVLLYKTSDDNNTANSIPIPAATATEWFPVIGGGMNSHDLSGLRFRSTLINHSFTVEYLKG